MFTKKIEMGSEFVHTGTPRVRYIDPRDTRLFSKTASHDALDFIRQLPENPAETVVLVLAMGASDYYGCNRNGDAFAENPVYLGNQPLVSAHETLPRHYQSFERGCNFVHHRNKDVAKSVGRVVKAFYNPVMHRVELLLSVFNAKAPTFVQKIKDGEFPGVSMGCRIKYDVCNICGNKAPTRAQYCEHVNNLDPRYGLNKILPDGRGCFVWNPSADFFDISWVFKPADRIGYSLATRNNIPKIVCMSAPEEPEVKVASDVYSVKCAHSKVSDIYKQIRGVACLPASASAPVFDVDPLPNDLVQEASKHPLSVALHSLQAIGMHPTTIDVYRIICTKAGAPFSEDEARTIPLVEDAMLQSSCVDKLAGYYYDLVLKKEPFFISDSFLHVAAPHFTKRAMYREHLLRTYAPDTRGGAMAAPLLGVSPMDAYYKGTQSVLEVRDPDTGKTYQTQRGYASQTAWENKKKQLTEAGVLAAGTGLAYKGLGLLKGPTGLLRFPVAAAGAVGTAEALRNDTPTIKTTTGERIDYNTPLVEKRGAAYVVRNASRLEADPVLGPLPDNVVVRSLLTAERKYATLSKSSAVVGLAAQDLSTVDRVSSDVVNNILLRLF